LRRRTSVLKRKKIERFFGEIVGYRRVRAKAMLNASVTRELSMDEILQKIERSMKSDEKAEAAMSTIAPRSAEIVELAEAVRDNDLPRDGTDVEDPSVHETSTQAQRTGRRKIEPESQLPETASGEAGKRLVADTAEPAARDVEHLGAAERDRHSSTASAMGGARTLEDVMRELLRPVLQGWLDEKLPAVIERQVRAELARAFSEAAAL
jgi:uncharacterized protein